MTASSSVASGARAAINAEWLGHPPYDLAAQAVAALIREGRLVGAGQSAVLARLEALMGAQPVALTPEQAEALAAAGNKAANDQAHENLCGCIGWPEKCTTSGQYWPGRWDTGVFEMGMPAVLGLWEVLRAGPADELARLRKRVTELEAAPTVVYRAEHPDAGIVLGHYGTAAAAREHCETVLRREVGDAVFLGWVPDDGSEHAPEELCIGEDVVCSGYIVTALELDSVYDAEADE